MNIKKVLINFLIINSLISVCGLSIITPYSGINKKLPRIVFFTGGNSLMPKDIYSSFLSKLGSNYEVSIIQNNYKNTYTNSFQKNTVSESILEQLYKYSLEGDILPIGHSSGCTTLLNYCSKLNIVDKMILLDPVNNNLEPDNIDFTKFKSVLQINAEKSYKWKYNSGLKLLKNPFPKVPFIPAFQLDTKNFNNLTKIEILDYGHCDILDTAFSNVMHQSFAEGTNDRDSIDKYKDFLALVIDAYAKDNLFIKNDKNGKNNENDKNGTNNKENIIFDQNFAKSNFNIDFIIN